MGTAITDFRPMLAKAEIVEAIDKGFFPSPVWVMEPKHDGMRAIIEVDASLPGGIRISSRSGLGYTDHLHDSHKELLKLMIPDQSIVDGELAAIKRFAEIEGVQVPVVDFNRTMRIMGSGSDKARAKQLDGDGIVTFLVFDVVKWNGADLISAPHAMDQKFRRTVLESSRLADMPANEIEEYSGKPPYFLNPQFVPHRPTYEEFLENKIEGAIMKRQAATYQAGKRPSKTWIKIKAEKTFDVVVTGFTNGNGKYEGQIGAIEFGAYLPDGTLQYVGRCSGMDDEERKIWSEVRDAWTDEHKGLYVIEVKANEMVGSGEYRTPRHPQYVVLRTDKEPVECLMEQFKEDDR